MVTAAQHRRHGNQMMEDVTNVRDIAANRFRYRCRICGWTTIIPGR
jgi:hypothetical protein